MLHNFFHTAPQATHHLPHGSSSGTTAGERGAALSPCQVHFPADELTNGSLSVDLNRRSGTRMAELRGPTWAFIEPKVCELLATWHCPS